MSNHYVLGSDGNYVFILKGVPGVIAVLSEHSYLIFGLKMDSKDKTKISSCFMEPDTEYANHPLDDCWGWHNRNYPYITERYRGWHAKDHCCILTADGQKDFIESQFNIIKGVYERNTKKIPASL
jgi:hypothetical protein